MILVLNFFQDDPLSHLYTVPAEQYRRRIFTPTKKPRLTTPGPTKVNYKTEHKTPILSLKLKDQSIKLFSLPIVTYLLPALITIT